MKRTEDILFNRTLDVISVKILLVRHGWNVCDLARAMQRSPAAIHNILKGRRPSTKLLPDIAKTLGVSVRRITKPIPESGPLSYPDHQAA